MASTEQSTVVAPPQFSVIIPVYNTENYVAAAVQSVLRQTERSLEVIIVDDGSTDSSLEICKRLAAEDVRVKVVSQTNAGQGVARNRGLDLAVGEYVAFVDSDDTLEPDLFSAAKDLIGEADFLNFGFDFIDEAGATRQPVAPYSVRVLEGDAIFRSALLDIHVFTAPWNKIYRRAVIEAHGIRFPALRAWEDSYFSREMARVSRKAVFDPTVRYHALMRAGSTSRVIDFTKFNDAVALFDLERKAFAAQLSNPDVAKIFEAHLLKFMTHLLVLAALRTRSRAEYLRCYEIATQHGFAGGAAAPEVLAQLPLRVRLVAGLSRHPLLLLMSVRLAAAVGLRPY